MWRVLGIINYLKTTQNRLVIIQLIERDFGASIDYISNLGFSSILDRTAPPAPFTKIIFGIQVL